MDQSPERAGKHPDTYSPPPFFFFIIPPLASHYSFSISCFDSLSPLSGMNNEKDTPPALHSGHCVDVRWKSVVRTFLSGAKIRRRRRWRRRRKRRLMIFRFLFFPARFNLFFYLENGKRVVRILKAEKSLKKWCNAWFGGVGNKTSWAFVKRHTIFTYIKYEG